MARAAAAAFILTGFFVGAASADEVPVTLSHDILTSYLAISCGPVHTERFEVPDDAIVTNAAMHATADVANTTALDAVIEVRVGAALLASNHTSELPRWLGAGESLDLAALNGALLNVTASQGNVSLDLVVSVCPTLGAAAVRLDQAIITYVRTTANVSGNGTSTALPPIIGISIGGDLNGTVSEGTATTLAIAANGTVGASVQVSWFVDGQLVGHGAALSNFSFTPGPHNVTVRASDGTTVRTYARSVNVQSLPRPSYPLPLLPLLAALTGVAMVGMAVGATDAGRYLLFSAGYGSIFARLKQPSLLDHFVRGTLYQVIRENPGIHFAELRRRAKIANGAASYHLRVLEKGGYIKVVIAGTRTHFHTTDQPLDENDYGIVGADREVLEVVTQAPGISQTDLATGVKRSPSAVSRSVRRLVSLGYVTTTRQDGRVHIFPRPVADAAPATTPMWPDEGA